MKTFFSIFYSQRKQYKNSIKNTIFYIVIEYGYFSSYNYKNIFTSRVKSLREHFNLLPLHATTWSLTILFESEELITVLGGGEIGLVT